MTTNPDDTDCSKEFDDILLHIRAAQGKRSEDECECECECESDRDVEAGFAKATGSTDSCANAETKPKTKSKTSFGIDAVRVTAASSAGIDACNNCTKSSNNNSSSSNSNSNSNNNNISSNNAEDTKPEYSLSSSNTTDQDYIAAKQQSIIRTTPGAFAIHNPMFWSSSSSSSSPDGGSSDGGDDGGVTGQHQQQQRQRPHAEQRQSFRSMSALGTNYSSSQRLQLGSIPETMLPNTSVVVPGVAHDLFNHHRHYSTATPCVTAVCVGNDSEIYEGKIVDDLDDGDDHHPNNNITPPKKYNNGKTTDYGRQMERIPRWLIGSLLLMLLGIAVAFGTMLNTKEQQQQQPVLDHANNNTGGGEINSSSSSGDIELRKQQRKDYLISLIAPISGPAGARVFDRLSKDISMDRLFALDWLVDDAITASLIVNNENSSTPITSGTRNESSSSSSSSSQEQQQQQQQQHILSPLDTTMEWKILQRYVLVLLFFATDGYGHSQGEGWDIECSFLSSDLDECLWNQATPTSWQKIHHTETTILDTISDTTGVICNDDGRVRGLMMRWNELSGTLPHELSYLKDTLEEIDFGSGAISGAIPSSFGKLTRLKGLALDDNCLSGTIPKSLSAQLSSIERVNTINNPNLNGSLNGFCNANANINININTKTHQGDGDGETSSINNWYKDGILAVAGDCGVGHDNGGVECECCICCDGIDYQCHDQQLGNSWKSYNFNSLSEDGFPKSFRKKLCRPKPKVDWAIENCPCYIDTNSKNKNHSAVDVEDEDGIAQTFKVFECTKDCDQDRAHDTLSFMFLW